LSKAELLVLLHSTQGLETLY